MIIETEGRTDLDSFFTLSPVLDEDGLPHTPLLVFTQPRPDTVHVKIVARARDALCYPDDTPVMCQWPGERRSDFFRFTIRDLRAAIEVKDEKLLSQLRLAGHVVEYRGPRGGFRGLHWETPRSDTAPGRSQTTSSPGRG